MPAQWHPPPRIPRRPARWRTQKTINTSCFALPRNVCSGFAPPTRAGGARGRMIGLHGTGSIGHHERVGWDSILVPAERVRSI